MSSINVRFTPKTPIFHSGLILGSFTVARRRSRGMTLLRMTGWMDVLLRITRLMHRNWQRMIGQIFKSFRKSLTFWQRSRQVMTPALTNIWKSTWKIRMKYLHKSRRTKTRFLMMRRTLARTPMSRKLLRQSHSKMRRRVAKVARTRRRSQKVCRKIFQFSLFWKSKNLKSERS